MQATVVTEFNEMRETKFSRRHGLKLTPGF